MDDSTLKWNAELYQHSSALQFRLGLMTIERLGPRDGERILDVGCGNGRVTIELAKRIPGGRVTGVEVSAEMAAKARENIASSGITNAEIVNINALDINFDSEFDTVFSNSAIHWIPDLKTMYRLIHRALRPGGRIMIQTGLREKNSLSMTVLSLLVMAPYVSRFSDLKLPWRFLTEEENRELLERTGFSEIDLESFTHSFEFESIEELAGYLESAPMVPFLPLLPEGERERFKEEFVRTYLDKNSGRMEVSSRRVLLSARKPALQQE